MFLIFGFLNKVLDTAYDAAFATKEYDFTLRSLRNYSRKAYELELVGSLKKSQNNILEITKSYERGNLKVLGIGEDFFGLIYDDDFCEFHRDGYNSYDIRPYLKKLKKVIIPDSVIKIDKNAFNPFINSTPKRQLRRLDNLKEISIVIPDSVTEIGTDAFYGIKHIEYHGSASGAPWEAKYMN